MKIMSWIDRLTGRDLLKQVLDVTTHLEHMMTAVQDSLDGLTDAVQNISVRYQAKVAELQAALEAERLAASTTAASEAAEDVDQNAALAAAQAATDAALVEVQGIPAELDALSAQLNAVGAETTPDPEPAPPTEPTV